jgi:hypothetical protein
VVSRRSAYPWVVGTVLIRTSSGGRAAAAPRHARPVDGTDREPVSFSDVLQKILVDVPKRTGVERPTRREVVGSLTGAVAVGVGGVAVGELAPTPVERISPAGVSDGQFGPDDTDGPKAAAFAVGRRTPVDDGLRDDPHSVFVVNGFEATREISVALSRRRFGSWRSVASRTFGLDPGHRVAYRLVDPGRYRFSLAADGVGGTVDVERSAFDCNDSTTTAVVRTGGVQSDLTSTTLGCSW